MPVYMRLILVGNIDQLLSVVAGNELYYIIDFWQIHVVKLIRILCKAQSIHILMKSHAANVGQFSDISNGQ